MMANSSDDPVEASKYGQDMKRRVKFHTGGSKSSIQFSMPSIQQMSKQQPDNMSSSSGSADDDNDEASDNLPASSYQAGSQVSSSSSTNRKSKKTKWELLEGYRDKNVKISKPVNYEGILLKRRNWPMKGWHKRYFILVDGILSYGKSKTDMTKSKVHGTINAFLSIVSYSASSRRILIDYSTQSSVFICHLKARTMQDFEAWIESLKQHRLYYQYKCLEQSSFSMHRHQPASSSSTSSNAATSTSTSNNRNSANMLSSSTGSHHSHSESNLKHNNSFAAFTTTSAQNTMTSSSLNSSSSATHHAKSNSNTSNISQINNSETSRNLEIINQINANKKLIPADDQILDQVFKNVEDNLMSLSKILSSLYLQSLAPSTNQQTVGPTAATTTPSGYLQPPNQYQPHHSHQASTSSFDFVTMMNTMNIQHKLHSSKSNPNLVINEVLTLPTTNTSNLPTVNVIGNGSTASNSTITSSGGGHNSPKLVSRDSQSNLSSNSSSIVADDGNFRINFYQGAKSINEQLIYIYQQLLLKKQALAAVSNIEESLHRAHRSQSVMSSVSLQDSQLQFYDAIEDFSESDTGSDSGSEQESEIEAANESVAKSKKPAIVPEELQGQKILNRRRKLPATSPDTSQVSMWNILRKAIGKDLSKISLPVILNEPIGILQRLCEEIEYSDLLDTASGLQDSFDRMVYVAAFVISGYSSSNYRTGAKNFNPLLGETYELIRPDKGWKYVGEQVSHHPPISSTHCQSKNFIHEQIFHAKIKFWGKSMEVHPEGYSRVTFPKYNETYQWNKIVMYVHNVMGSGRKIEHYGEINIRCTNGTSCTITFPKANYSSQKNEFYGDIIYENVVKRKIFGQWHESFMCGMDNTAKTIWRMGAMPEDAHLYYGFTRFAIELNEFTEDLKDHLAPTDTRYRPDQRNLELGQVEKAELEKHRIEEIQRNRRKEMESRGEHHRPLWFTMNESAKEWQFNNQYWIKRENPGFKAIKDNFPTLW